MLMERRGPREPAMGESGVTLFTGGSCKGRKGAAEAGKEAKKAWGCAVRGMGNGLGKIRLSGKSTGGVVMMKQEKDKEIST